MATPLKALSLLTSRIAPKTLSPQSPRLLSPLFRKEADSFVNQLKRSSNKSLTSHEEIPGTYSSIKIKLQLPAANYKSKPFRLDKYGIRTDDPVHILGKGSFGTVIKGHYKGVEVAIKILDSRKQKDTSDKNALKLSHKNIIKVIEIITANREGLSLIVMEYFDSSQNLQSILDNTSLCEDFRTRLNFSRDVCGGLEFCHKSGILHLDIKPKNLLVCNGVCKICDFGNSATISEISAGQAYAPKGTVAYAAPEILLGLSPSIKSDVYSLGIVLWQMRTNEVPYENCDSEVVIYKVVKFKIRPETMGSSARKETDKYSQLYRWCWQQEPNDRPDVSRVLQVLSTI